MNIKNIKNINIVLVVTANAFAFPLQVIYGTPLCALLPYLFLGILFLLTYFSKIPTPKIIWNIRKPIILVITIYLLMLFINTSWQVFFEFITIYQALSAIFIYSFPVLFFIYFRFFVTSQQFRVFIFAVIMCGLLSGIYFVYDSYSMMVSLQLNDYSQKAIEYIQMRAIPGNETNLARVTIGSRSHGLLEKHSVSAAWIVFGFLATLTILSSQQHLKRSLAIMFFGLMLLISLNFTAIVGFILLVFLMEYKAYYIFRISTYINIVAKLITIALAAGLVLFFVSGFLNVGGLNEVISQVLTFQVDLVNGKNEFGRGSYFGTLFYDFFLYPFLIIDDYPLGLLIGDGFSSFGMPKGGDLGIVETLHRFGLPFFWVVFIGLIRLIFRSINKINRNEIGLVEKQYLWFAASIASYIIFAEVHYSIWNAKSVLPILFIALAIFDRYIHQQNVYYVDSSYKSLQDKSHHE